MMRKTVFKKFSLNSISTAYKKTINIEDVLIQDEKKDYVLLPVILDMPTRYKFVAKKPHACVWDESYTSLDKYFKK